MVERKFFVPLLHTIEISDTAVSFAFLLIKLIVMMDNADSLGEDYLLGPRPEDGDENVDENEGENDLEWRKERLEREKFIESFEKVREYFILCLVYKYS